MTSSVLPEVTTAAGSGLAAALAYENSDVVDSFLRTYDMPRDEAELLFEDVRRWIWLAANARSANIRIFIDQKMTLFDEMWHTFVLFTKDYSDFCQRYAGVFCHHFPTRTAERIEFERRSVEEPKVLAAELQAQYTSMITLVATELGEDVAVRWFSVYREKHTDEYIRSIHKYGKQHAARVGTAAD